MSLCHTLFLNTSQLEDSKTYDKWYNLMPKYRRDKINSFKFEKDKKLSLGAGILLYRTIEKNALDPKTVVCFTEDGKPYFSPDNNIKFNLSHSGEIVMYSFSDIEVGCDIEKEDHGENGIAKRYFSREENAFLDSFSGPEERKKMFYRIWTLKESFVKSTGKGIFSGMSSFSVIPQETGIKITQNTETGAFSFHEFLDFDGYACSCCIRGLISSEDFTMETVNLTV